MLSCRLPRGGPRPVSLAKKLNLKQDMKARVLGKPKGVDLDDVVTTSSVKAEGLLLFVTRMEDVDTKCAPVIAAAKEDRVAWVAYPKAGQLDTDLNRDILARRLEQEGIQAVRQVAIDTVWSALRFRPGT
ncbi:hypothetical protein HUA75_31115 [Myxococcus sp. CA040A]|nr:hypothetical protein [Myxococcus sp. CA040A]NTX57762.1 hypothetical protein [Myxococcus sp. CA039A]